jgi:hypothetical protein
MNEVSLVRLYVLRGAYLMIAVGMGSEVWPQILSHGSWELMAGAVKCMLGALTLLCVLGLRYPIKMLPLLFWEVAWKLIWLLSVALPLWRENQMDADTRDFAFAVCFVVIVIAAIPLRYVWRHYGLAAGDPWGRVPVAGAKETA